MARPQHSTPPRAHTDRTGLRSALWLPLFDGLADPALVARLAAEAEEAGWHGVFVWDQLDWRAPVREVADPWITLAAIATATQRLRLGPWSRPLPAAGRPRSPGKPRRWTGSAVAASPSASAWAPTASPASCPRPASNSTTGCGARCSTRRSRSSPPPGPVRRCTTAAGTTPWRASGSCPDRCSGPGCRCGWRGSPATSNRCAGPPGTTASSRPTWSTPISSPRSSPPSPICASTPRRRTTSPSACRSGPTRRPGPRRAPPGGWSSSRGTGVGGRGARRAPRRPGGALSHPGWWRWSAGTTTAGRWSAAEPHHLRASFALAVAARCSRTRSSHSAISAVSSPTCSCGSP